MIVVKATKNATKTYKTYANALKAVKDYIGNVDVIEKLANNDIAVIVAVTEEGRFYPVVHLSSNAMFLCAYFAHGGFNVI